MSTPHVSDTGYCVVTLTIITLRRIIYYTRARWRHFPRVHAHACNNNNHRRAEFEQLFVANRQNARTDGTTSSTSTGGYEGKVRRRVSEEISTLEDAECRDDRNRPYYNPAAVPVDKIIRLLFRARPSVRSDYSIYNARFSPRRTYRRSITHVPGKRTSVFTIRKIRPTAGKKLSRPLRR